MKLKNSQVLGIIGAIAIITYFVYRKKPLSVKDMGKPKDSAIPKQPIVGLELTELKKRGGSELQFTGSFKSPLKEPLYIKPRNVIPNVYDRGIGDEVNFLGNMIDGKATVNITNACKCSDKSKRLPLEIPKIN